MLVIKNHTCIQLNILNEVLITQAQFPTFYAHVPIDCAFFHNLNIKYDYKIYGNYIFHVPQVGNRCFYTSLTFFLSSDSYIFFLPHWA